MKVAFVTDSGTGMSAGYWKERGIYCLPLQIECDGVSYDEGVTIDHDTVIRELHNKKVMKTSLPKLGLIEECFEQIKDEGYDTVFCVPICRGLSGALDAMEMVASQVGLKYYGVDTYVTAVVEACCIQTAKDMWESGQYTMEQIIEKLNRISESADTILIFEDLQHMVRGGRLTPAAALLAGLLKIRPVLHLDKSTSGRVDVMAKVRTMTRAQERVIDTIINKGVNKDYTFILAHVDALEPAKEYAKRIEAAIEGAKVQIIDLVSTVGVHTGLGCLALQVFNPNA
ncbi:MAG: DegV family protein [Faecalicoccus sp.]|nr:DegV family protein [Faecalicoccus sp.]